MNHHALFRDLYAHFDFVCRTLRRHGVPTKDVPDLAQEVYCRVYQHISAYDRERPAKTWLYGFVVRVAADYRRLRSSCDKLSSGGLCDPAPSVQELFPSAEESVLAGEALGSLVAAAQRLKPKLRDVWILHDFEQMPMPVIARTLGVPLNIGYNRLRLARAKLKKRFLS